MLRVLAVFVLLWAVFPAAAQDMPLSLVLLPGETWQLVPGDSPTVADLAGGPNGDVYLAHHEGQQIDRIDREGKRHAFARPSAPVKGLACAPDGRLYACQPLKKRIIALDAKGQESVLVEDLPAQYLAVTRNGSIYATVPTENAIYRMGRDGKKQRVDQSTPTALGVTLWRDQGTLVVGDMEGLNLTAFRIDKDGTLSAREQYYALRRRVGEDGLVPSMTVDSADRLYAATREGVQVFDPTGRMSGVLLRPERQPVRAVAFGGADLDRLYIACGNKLYVRKMKAKGVAAAAKAQ
ncbi:MAG TPA: SMP-30/gluconolactonase/LRE family protein [Gemmataceae bacterium]|nr:SMP-30/gluconolactonase/LRE family protein [Gemmataceae bacterium]